MRWICSIQQAELDLGLVGLVADHAADDVEIALHHRDRVVDLMGHAGGDLADRGELLGHDELLGGRLQLQIGVLEIPGSLAYPRVQFLVPLPQLAVALLDLVEQGIEVKRHAADLVARCRQFGAGGQVAALHFADRRRDAFERHEYRLRPAQEDRHGCRRDHDECERDDQERLKLRVAERLLQKSDIEHADALAIAVDQRLIGRNVPVVDHERAVEPGAPLVHHRRAHRRRHPRPQRAPALEQPDIGRDPHVVQEQRRRSLAALRQAGRLIDEVVDRIDELQILIEQNAPDQRSRRSPGGRRPARRMHDHAVRFRAAIGRHRVRRRHQVETRTLGKNRRNRRKLVIAEDVDAG